MPHEIGIFVRSATELDRSQAAVEEAGLSFKILDEPTGGDRSGLCTLRRGISCRCRNGL